MTLLVSGCSFTYGDELDNIERHNIDLTVYNDFFIDGLDIIRHPCDFKICPSFKILKLLAFNVSPVEVISVMISDEPVKG